jgi:hypothetical protein
MSRRAAVQALLEQLRAYREAQRMLAIRRALYRKAEQLVLELERRHDWGR